MGVRGEERIEKEDDERGGEEKREKTKKGYEGAEEVGEEGKK